jgi:hypothetical protein
LAEDTEEEVVVTEEEVVVMEDMAGEDIVEVVVMEDMVEVVGVVVMEDMVDGDTEVAGVVEEDIGVEAEITY